MYEVAVQKLFGDRSEGYEKSFKDSVQAANFIEATIGDMITTWHGRWELDSRPVGNPEASYYEYHGERVEPFGDSTAVAFKISTWS